MTPEKLRAGDAAAGAAGGAVPAGFVVSCFGGVVCGGTYWATADAGRIRPAAREQRNATLDARDFTVSSFGENDSNSLAIIRARVCTPRVTNLSRPDSRSRENHLDRSASSECTGCLNASSVRFDEVSDDCESESGAACFPITPRVRAVESLENPREVSRGDSRTRITDRDHHAAVFTTNPLRGDRHGALPGVTNCILQQVGEDLPECGPVGRHQACLRCYSCDDPGLLLRRGNGQSVHDFLDDRRNLQLDGIWPPAARLDS